MRKVISFHFPHIYIATLYHINTIGYVRAAFFSFIYRGFVKTRDEKYFLLHNLNLRKCVYKSNISYTYTYIYVD